MDMCKVCNGWEEAQPCTCILWVTNRFPRAGSQVLVSTRAGVRIAAYSKQGYWHAGSLVVRGVKAWQPLPRKYKEANK